MKGVSIQDVAVAVGIAAGLVTIVTGVVLLVRYLHKLYRHRLPPKYYSDRIELLVDKLEKIEFEHQRFDQIRDGQHLIPTVRGTPRISLLEIPFDDIRERVASLSGERRYRGLANRILPLIDARDRDNPVEAVNAIDPLLRRFERKMEKEIASLQRKSAV